MKECGKSYFVRLPVAGGQEDSQLGCAAPALRQGEVEVGGGGEGRLFHHLLQGWLDRELLDNLVARQQPHCGPGQGGTRAVLN